MKSSPDHSGINRKNILKTLGVWAPDITYYNNEYRIYYSYSVWVSTNNPGIGLATSDTPEGPFTDQGPVFRESDLGMANCMIRSSAIAG